MVQNTDYKPKFDELLIWRGRCSSSPRKMMSNNHRIMEGDRRSALAGMGEWRGEKAKEDCLASCNISHNVHMIKSI